ncbi:MAG: PspC domain-containing protein [Gammaproteobacteria bacterium]|nr:PspC domain-containing protein [Gammaproteobacteria bacterium]NNE06279.1 PspC domain-containing protein [Xanthomonadales bacterium]
MTSNHHERSRRHNFSRHRSARVDRRPDGALLAGVCAGIAERLGWNTWALRLLFVLGLLIKPIPTGLVYLALAFLVPRVAGRKNESTPEPGLASEELSARNQRIADLERRFRDLEAGGEQRK